MTAEDGFDWEALTAAARDVAERAYTPYSRYPVGAAARVDDGRLVVGCNVENAAYGVALCAECGLVSALHAGGGGRLTHFVCVNGKGAVIMGRWHPLGATAAAVFFGFMLNLQTQLSFADKLPSELLGAVPYLATIVAVAGFVGRVRPPAADGEPYVKS